MMHPFKLKALSFENGKVQGKYQGNMERQAHTDVRYVLGARTAHIHLDDECFKLLRVRRFYLMNK